MVPSPRWCAPAGTECPSKKERRTDKEAKRKDCGPALYADQQSETSQSDQERLAVMTGLWTIFELVCYTSLSMCIIYHVKEKESNYQSYPQNQVKMGKKITGRCLFLVCGMCSPSATVLSVTWRLLPNTWMASLLLRVDLGLAGLPCKQVYYTTFLFFSQIYWARWKEIFLRIG